MLPLIGKAVYSMIEKTQGVHREYGGMMERRAEDGMVRLVAVGLDLNRY